MPSANDRKSEFTRERAIEWLTRVVLTPAGDVDAGSSVLNP
jgi:hypothetical protein